MTPFYRLVLPASPTGPLTLIASEQGLWRVRFGVAPKDDRAGGRVPEAAGDRGHPVLGPAAQALEAYFGGAPDPFHDVPLDLRGRTAFQLQVLKALRRIPRGSVRTYGDLAGELERGSPRAVGQAVGANPLPIIIPCHRVVARDLRMGGFSGGLDRKVLLLEQEGFQVEGQGFHARLRMGTGRASEPASGSPATGSVSVPAPG
jgi:methylated-DNA-[protein]-cysteine S-methyltransferase